MLRKKRNPVTPDGRELTPELCDEIVKEIEDADPADLTPVRVDGPMLRPHGRFWWFRLRLRGRCEEAWWKVEARLEALRQLARKATHRHARA